MISYAMPLGELFPEAIMAEHDAQCEVLSITQNSQQVTQGSLFVARDGAKFNAADFVEQAIDAGASAILVDEQSELPELSVPVVRVKNLNQQLGDIASRFYHFPSHDMKVVGVTGTNGKTSCCYFLAQALEFCGVKTAFIGTIGNGFLSDLASATHTTPDAVSLQALLAAYRDAGAQAVVMEVSSHALDQGRVNGTRFYAGGYTNLTRDHLDYHGTMAAYATAKAKLFTEHSPQYAVLCAASQPIADLAKTLNNAKAVNVQTYGVKEASLYCQQVVYKPNGMTLVLNLRGKEIEINTGLLGAFNVQNLLLVAGVLHAFGISHLDIAQSIEALITVPGRMQVVTTPISHGQPLPHVVVDYAHTPDALEKAIAACRQHATKDSRIICVFGCGGDRDQGKRMQMADIASQTADYCIITSDNPRYEDPMSIINMIENGMVSRDYGVEVDRADAIKKAIISASENDIVLIAGKGHENYQELNGTRYPFSDEVCARASLSEVVS